MKVIKEETETGTLKSLTFRPDGEEPEDFKLAVKTWLGAYTTMGWEEFFNRLTFFQADRITISMV